MEKSGNCPLRDFQKKAQYRVAVLWGLPRYGVITRKMSDVTDDNSETTLPLLHRSAKAGCRNSRVTHQNQMVTSAATT